MNPRPFHPERTTDTDPRRGFFDHHARHWDRDVAATETMLTRLRSLAEVVGVRSGMDVLEVGCGTGQVTPWLAATVQPGRVMAIDFSPAMLAEARAKGVPAELRCLDVCAEPPPSRAFDLVLCFQCFPHFRDRATALRHLGAGLKTGGRLVILHLCGREQVNGFHRHVGGVVGEDMLPENGEWPELLTPAGLVPVTLKDEPDLFLLEAALKA